MLMRTVQALAAVAALLLPSPGANAAETGRGTKVPEPVRGVSGPVQPWTGAAVRNDPRDFQFAIVSDRCGGHRPGVFGDAVRRLNLLQPEFVMCVGDLIEGYTEDRKEIRRQWDEFDGLARDLSMRFFYVPGNHDISNEVMGEAWKERYGASHYSFVHENVLFVCLNSQDPPIHHLSEAQIGWLKGVLDENRNVRWTLVFLHTPLWHRDSERSSWEKAERLLEGRRHTVFAGHEHHYAREVRRDSRYFILSTTGGSSQLRGRAFGEFDHVVWVTMKDDGPIVANLFVPGIFDERMTPDVGGVLRRLADSPPVRLSSALVGDPGSRKLRAEARLTNNEDVPMKISLGWRKRAGFRIRPGKVSRTVPPNGVEKVEYELVSRAPVVPDETGPVVLGYRVSLDFEGLPPIEQEGTLAFGFDRAHSCPRAAPRNIDGRLDDWDALPYDVRDPKGVGMIAGSWKGPEDARFRFGVARDGEFVYVGVEAFDDAETEKDRDYWRRDAVIISIDPRTREARDAALAAGEKPGGITFGQTPDGQMPDYYKATLPKGAKWACIPAGKGWTAELAVPLEVFAGNDFRLNVGQIDTDGDEEWGTLLQWRPGWDSRDHYPESGIFVLE